MARHPLSDMPAIQAEIEALSRNPFRGILASLLEALPDDKTLAYWARENPEKLFSSIAKITPLAGYNETITHEHNHMIAITQMSDSQIEARLLELQRPAFQIIEEDSG